MPNREKVIRAVETCFDSWIDKHRNMGLDLQAVEQMKRDALELLNRKPSSDWISVKDRLPERGVIVLCAVYGTDVIKQEDDETMEDAVSRSMSGPGRVEVGFLDEDGWWTDYAFGGPMVIRPSYWMPMPDAPEKETEE